MEGGKNPLKVNLSVGIPDIVSAKMGAVGPGIADTGISFLWHSSTSLKPGSDINGVPASLTKATLFPL